MNKEISEKAHLRSDFRKKEYLLEWGSNPRKYFIFRAEIEKFFVSFLFQVKMSKVLLKLTDLYYMMNIML